MDSIELRGLADVAHGFLEVIGPSATRGCGRILAVVDGFSWVNGHTPYVCWARGVLGSADGVADRGREGWTVVDDSYWSMPGSAEYLRVLLDGEGRSVGTARAYAGRLALYLTWAAGAGVDETSPGPEELAAFARWLERTPSRKHRPGRNRGGRAQPAWSR